MNTNNDYLDHAIYEVQVVLDCSREDALKVVSWVNCLGGDPIDFIHRLPSILNDPAPNTADTLKALQVIAATNNVRLSDVCFPTGYRNREARREAKRKNKERKAR